ncbi:MAG: S26 family signal peptidase [Sphingobium sp.]
MTRRHSSTADAPLFAWGEALRARAKRRRKVCHVAFGVTAGALALGLTIAFPPAPRLVWNASASAPIELYWVSPGGAIVTGDMVIARVPERYRHMAAARRYLPMNVPLVKRVAAGPGDEICALGATIFLDGRPIVQRHDKDGKGRPMPRWQGCIRLRSGQYFLLMADSPASFDGRYFGISNAPDIIGPAWLIWQR